jgi:iron-sulfur cluster insertion protein
MLKTIYILLYNEVMEINDKIIVSKTALSRISKMREIKENSNILLRITVEGGGCSGFQYNLNWEEQNNSKDSVFENSVIIDEMSLSFLKDSTLDFVSNMMGEDFKILNPNAVASCGCGTSFAV